MEHTQPGPCGGEPSGQDVWANIWCAVLAVVWAVHLLQWAWNSRWPGPEVLLSLLPVNLGLYRFQKFQKKRLCHKSVLMTGTPMASSKSWRGFAAPPVRSKNRNHAR